MAVRDSISFTSLKYGSMFGGLATSNLNSMHNRDCCRRRLIGSHVSQSRFSIHRKPGGNVLDANDTKADNAAVFGVRTTLTF
jgi:hypothetical protein